eukprot:4719730-Alexandrium_andersonii.AAC.1
MAPKRSLMLRKRPAAAKAAAAPPSEAAKSEASEEGFTVTGSLDEKLKLIKGSEQSDQQKVAVANQH